MSQSALTNNDQSISKEAAQKGQRRLLQYLATGSLIGTFMTGSAPLFLLTLGASPFLIGLLATATSIGNTSRLLGVKLMPKMGKARMMWVTRLGSGFFLLLLIPIALYSQSTTISIAWVALVVLVLRQSTLQIGGSAWWPLVQDNTPPVSQSAFITRMRVTQRICSLGVPLFVGWYLGTQPLPERFALPFTLALVLVLVGSWVVNRVSENPMPLPQETLWKRIIDVLRVPAIRQYCICFSTIYFVETATMPFWVVALTERGLPANQYVWMLSIMGLGELLTLQLWGRLVEKHGSRAVLNVVFVLMGFMAPAWLLLPIDPTNLVIWAGFFFFFWGVVVAGCGFGQTRAMIDCVPAQYQGEGFAVPMFLLSLVGGLGGLFGGLAFDWISTQDMKWGNVEATHWYLTTIQALFLGGWLVSRHLDNR
tara:strand:+ start:1343 stop:2611 length:1269 start_codon:yes stop_codon:yes gene_type:complete